MRASALLSCFLATAACSSGGSTSGTTSEVFSAAAASSGSSVGLVTASTGAASTSGTRGTTSGDTTAASTTAGTSRSTTVTASSTTNGGTTGEATASATTAAASTTGEPTTSGTTSGATSVTAAASTSATTDNGTTSGTTGRSLGTSTAAGTTSGGTTTSGATTTSAASTTTGATTTSGTTAGAGTTGRATTSSTTGGSTTSGSTGTLLLFAGSASQLLVGTQPAGGVWSTSTYDDGTNFPTSLTVNDSGDGIGVYASVTDNTLNALTWSPTGWSAAPTVVDSTDALLAQPDIDATGGSIAYATFQDSTYHFHSVTYSAGAWSTPQAVGTSYGPVPAAIAALGANATLAFIDGQSPNTNFAAEADLVDGLWQTPTDLVGPESFTLAPSIIPLSAGPELMLIFMNQSAQIFSVTRSAGTWSTPATITSAFTNDPVALAPLPNGDAILAFRGTDSNLYWSLYSGGAWSTVAPFSSPSQSVDVAPAVTHGIGTHTAEIAFITGGVASSASLSGGAWTAPVTVGGTGLLGVSIAASP